MLNPMVQDIKRLRKIATVLTRHGFSAVVRGSALSRYVDNAEALNSDTMTSGSSLGSRARAVLEDLGATYVKLGQVLSTRVDLFPPDVIEELSLLRDRVPAFEFSKVRDQIESAFDARLEDLFAEFDEQALAAASIGQVHRAVTHQGQQVAVKVQRPGIRVKVEADLDLLYLVASMLEATIKDIELYNPRAIIEAFEVAIKAELDFNSEAKHSERFARNFMDFQGVEVPKVYHELSCDRVLTMAYVEGVALSRIVGGTPQAKQILHRILDATVKQVMYDGYFHADPHPGNLLIKPCGTVVYIDFGLMGQLTLEQQDVIIFTMISAMNRDVDGLARVLLRMGEARGRVDLRAFKQDVHRILDEFLQGHLGEVDVGRFMQSCTRVAQKHGLKVNANYVILGKVAATIEGLMRHLDPDLDLMEVGTPYAKQLTADRFSVDRLSETAIRALFRLSTSASDLPDQVEQVLMDLEGGNFEIQIKNQSLSELGSQVNTLGTRLLLSVVATGLALVSAILLKGSRLEIWGVAVTDIAGLLSLILAVLFFMWSLGWHMIGDSSDRRLRLKPWIKFFGRQRHSLPSPPQSEGPREEKIAKKE